MSSVRPREQTSLFNASFRNNASPLPLVYPPINFESFVLFWGKNRSDTWGKRRILAGLLYDHYAIVEKKCDIDK